MAAANTGLVLELTDGRGLIVGGDDLDEEEAKLLVHGYADGLLGSARLTKEMIEMLLNDPISTANFEVPLAIEPDNQALFVRGALNRLALAADGYWIDPDGHIPRTIH